MGDSALTDPKTFPTAEVLAERLGRADAAYRAVFEFMREGFPGLAEDWKFYNDTKCWLLKCSLKGKTVFWLSASAGYFRTTFYLSAAMEGEVAGSGLPDDAKAGFAASAGKKFRGVSIVMRSKKDLAAFKEALGMKLGAGGPSG